MICRYCHHEFEVDVELVGQELQCPNCNGKILASDKTVVYRCTSCKAQLEVEMWMLGTTVPCPVCQHDVRLSLDPATSRNLFSPQTEENDTSISLKPGDIFGKYKIEHCLGVGGMGEVYLATHTFLGSACAIKLLKKNITVKEEDKQRLLREARLTSSIHHQNLIAVLDADEDPATGILYIVMEYVDGVSIDQVLANGPMEEIKVLQIIRQVAEALQAAEEMQLVHRDIKPANIMLTSKGKIKLADLGIAKANSDTSVTLTMDNAILGTPHYASPEQLRSSHQVDVRADIYSLGATMYHMLSGDYPFPGDSVFTIMAQVLEQDPPPLQDRAKISNMTAQLVKDTMAKKPEDRPANMTEMIARIDKVLHLLTLQQQQTLHAATPAADQPQQAQAITLELRPRGNPHSAPAASKPATQSVRQQPPPTGSGSKQAAPASGSSLKAQTAKPLTAHQQSQNVAGKKTANTAHATRKTEKPQTGTASANKPHKMRNLALTAAGILLIAGTVIVFAARHFTAQQQLEQAENIDDALNSLETGEVRKEDIQDLPRFSLQGRTEFAANQKRQLAKSPKEHIFLAAQKEMYSKIHTRLLQELQTREKRNNNAAQRTAGTICGADGEDLLSESAQFLAEPLEGDPQSARHAEFYRQLKDYARKLQSESTYRAAPGGIALRTHLQNRLSQMDPLLLIQALMLLGREQESSDIKEQTLLTLLQDMEPDFSYSKFPVSALELPEALLLALLALSWDEVDGFSYGRSTLITELSRESSSVRPAVIAALLHAGCRTDIPNSDGAYPLHWAMKTKITSVVKDLLCAAPPLNIQWEGKDLIAWGMDNAIPAEALALLHSAGAPLPASRENVDGVYAVLWDAPASTAPIRPPQETEQPLPAAESAIKAPIKLPPYIPLKPAALEKPDSAAIALSARQSVGKFTLTARADYAKKKLAQVQARYNPDKYNYYTTQALQFYTALNSRLQQEIQTRQDAENTEIKEISGTLCPEGKSLLDTMSALTGSNFNNQDPRFNYYQQLKSYAQQCQNDSQYKDSNAGRTALAQLQEGRRQFDPLFYIQVLLHFMYADAGISAQTMIQLLADLDPDFSYSKFPPEALDLPESVISALLSKCWDEVDGASYGRSNLITELSRANQSGRNTVISALLAAGCNIDTADAQGLYPIHWAIKNTQFLRQFLTIAPDMRVKVKNMGIIEWGMEANMLYSTARRLLLAGAPLPDIPEDEYPPNYRALIHLAPASAK